MVACSSNILRENVMLRTLSFSPHFKTPEENFNVQVFVDVYLVLGLLHFVFGGAVTHYYFTKSGLLGPLAILCNTLLLLSGHNPDQRSILCGLLIEVNIWSPSEKVS